MVTAEDQRELLKVSYEMGELLVSSGYGSGKGWGMWEVVGHSRGFVDRNWRRGRFIILSFAFAGFQWMEVLGE
jgi:hypothetical protein